MKKMSSRRVEELLQLAAANPAHGPELLRALKHVEVIVLGEYFTGAGQIPWMRIHYCEHEGSLVVPCYTSRQALRAAALEHKPYLLAPFAEFMTVIRSYKQSHPVVVNLYTPCTWTILPEHMAALSTGAMPGTPRESGLH